MFFFFFLRSVFLLEFKIFREIMGEEGRTTTEQTHENDTEHSRTC